jgi:hypothetical protein
MHLLHPFPLSPQRLQPHLTGLVDMFIGVQIVTHRELERIALVEPRGGIEVDCSAAQEPA